MLAPPEPSFIRDILEKNNRYKIDWLLEKHFHSELARFISYLVNFRHVLTFYKKINNENPYFYVTYDKIKIDIGFSRWKAQRLKKRSQELGILRSIGMQGIPAKEYLYLNISALIQIIENRISQKIKKRITSIPDKAPLPSSPFTQQRMRRRAMTAVQENSSKPLQSVRVPTLSQPADSVNLSEPAGSTKLSEPAGLATNLTAAQPAVSYPTQSIRKPISNNEVSDNSPQMTPAGLNCNKSSQITQFNSEKNEDSDLQKTTISTQSSESSGDRSHAHAYTRTRTRLNNINNKINIYAQDDCSRMASPSLSQSSLSTLSGQAEGPVKKRKSRSSENIEEYLPIANRIADLVREKIRVNYSPQRLRQWASILSRLDRIDGVSIDRQKEALDYYEMQRSFPYALVIDSAQSFRDKYVRLETARQRYLEKQSRTSLNSPSTTMPSVADRSTVSILRQYWPGKTRWKQVRYEWCPKIQSWIFLSVDHKEIIVALGELYNYIYSEQSKNLVLLDGSPDEKTWNVLGRPGMIMDDYLDWLPEQHWISSRDLKAFHPLSALFLKFRQRLAERKDIDGRDVLTGKYIIKNS